METDAPIDLMKTVVFNIHDVALLLLAAECAMLAILLLVHRRVTDSRLLLAIFLFLNGLIALDVIIFWGDEVRYRMFDISPDIFFLFGLAVFLEGPVLYWFTRSMTGRDFSLSPTDTLHVLPAIAAPLYLYFVYYHQPEHIQHGLVLDFQIFQAPYFKMFVTAQKMLVIIYGVACLLRLIVFRKHGYFTGRTRFAWLQLLIFGFLLVWIWVFIAHLVGMQAPGKLSDFMGISGNYLILLLINALLFYGLVHPEVFTGLGTEAERGSSGPGRQNSAPEPRVTGGKY
jgi:hypothetical protein